MFEFIERLLGLGGPSPHFGERIKLTGRLTINLIGPDGRVKDHRVINNLIVNAGKNAIVSGTALSGWTYTAIGTGTNAPAVTDTALQTEVGTRVANTQTNPSGNVRRYDAVFGMNNPASAAAITEAGLFTASAGGTMLNRVTFAAVNKAVDDMLQVIFDITVS